MLKAFHSIVLVLVAASVGSGAGVTSFDTQYTITKVRSGQNKGTTFIAASSYEGTVIGIRFDGTIAWKNVLSGYMNHDLWCADLTGDGIDEMLAANSDGSVYCLNVRGETQWQFKKNEVPMYAVCAVKNGDTPYIACGGFDMNMYYLDAKGKLISTVASSTYSKQKAWHAEAGAPSNVHNVNFVRPFPTSDGNEKLMMAGFNNHMQEAGVLYEFDPLAVMPKSNKGVDIGGLKTLGDMHVCDTDGDGIGEILFGTSQIIGDAALGIYDSKSGDYRSVDLSSLRRKIDRIRYHVLQPRVIPKGASFEYLLLMGPAIVLLPPDLDVKKAEVLNSKYSYNDLWQVTDTKFILASSESGGSCIHLLDTSVDGWKNAYQNLEPVGNIAAIHARRAELKAQVDRFELPAHEVAGRPRPPVYFMSESLKSPAVASLAKRLESSSPRIQFLGNKYTNKVQYPPSWNRDTVVTNEVYRKKHDSRHDYKDPKMDQDGIVNLFAPAIDGDQQGVAYWGGHGNDPLFYSLETRYALVDRAWNNGSKKTMLDTDTAEIDVQLGSFRFIDIELQDVFSH